MLDMQAAANITPRLPFCSHRYAFFVSYMGCKYNGSQRQGARESDDDDHGTVQGALEWSLTKLIPRNRCCLTASSRTDKGVHAFMNCFTLPLIDFSTSTEVMREVSNGQLRSMNHEVQVKEVVLVPLSFHPRKSVTNREYVYRLAVLKNQVHKKDPDKSVNSVVHMIPITELSRLMPIS